LGPLIVRGSAGSGRKPQKHYQGAHRCEDIFSFDCMWATQRCAGWCGEWSCAGAVDMGVLGWVRAQCVYCVGHGVRCRLRTAPRLREFPVRVHAGYSVVCAAV
jgi:hypothetical protein